MSARDVALCDERCGTSVAPPISKMRLSWLGLVLVSGCSGDAFTLAGPSNDAGVAATRDAGSSGASAGRMNPDEGSVSGVAGQGVAMAGAGMGGAATGGAGTSGAATGGTLGVAGSLGLSGVAGIDLGLGGAGSLTASGAAGEAGCPAAGKEGEKKGKGKGPCPAAG